MLKAVSTLLTTLRITGTDSLLRSAALSTQAATAVNQNEDILTETNLKTNENVEKDKLYIQLEIELRGIDPAVLKNYSWFTTTAANHLGIKVGNCWAPRKVHHGGLMLLKSVHIFKKHRVQYEIRTQFYFLNFHTLTGPSLYSFLEYIESNLPEGVELHATKIEIQQVPEHLLQSPQLE